MLLLPLMHAAHVALPSAALYRGNWKKVLEPLKLTPLNVKEQ